jgi:LytS/YehU family sensor histidine kinase
VRRLYTVAPDTGGEMLTSLRHYLRAALPRMRESGSTLERETQLVGAYLSVLRIRMGERLGFTIELPEPLRDHAFPPMMLITLVENAIKHGLQPLPGGGSIAIRVMGGDGVVDVEVADTGVGFREVTGVGVGLANTRERLRGLYGDNASLRLARNQPCGVVARVRIPMTALA